MTVVFYRSPVRFRFSEGPVCFATRGESAYSTYISAKVGAAVLVLRHVSVVVSVSSIAFHGEIRGKRGYGRSGGRQETEENK